MLRQLGAGALATVVLSADGGAWLYADARELQDFTFSANSTGSGAAVVKPETHAAKMDTLPPVSKEFQRVTDEIKLSGGAPSMNSSGPNWRAIATAIVGAVSIAIAAAGGIGGGGILVPVFILLLQLSPKHAIALSNLTILGGAIANTALNVPKRHPSMDRTLIDWDIIVMMEPLTIFGAVFGSLLSKVLPSIVLTVSLVVVLACIGHRTLKKAVSTWKQESAQLAATAVSPILEDGLTFKAQKEGTLYPSAQTTADEASSTNQISDVESDCSYQALSDVRPSTSALDVLPVADGIPKLPLKVFLLTLCFAGTSGLTVLKGGGQMPSPLGVACGSPGFWLLYFSAVPWVFLFVIYFRRRLMAEYQQKVELGYTFGAGEVRWDSQNSLKFPFVCALAGLMAGLFGVGGGVVKGPLMLEMGVLPAVSSATAAAMILYTSAAASLSYAVFGMLDMTYGPCFFALGLVCTAVGQSVVSTWVKRNKRQSPIIFSIGAVLVLSSLLVTVNNVVDASSHPLSTLLEASGVCNVEVK